MTIDVDTYGCPHCYATGSNNCACIVCDAIRASTGQAYKALRKLVTIWLKARVGDPRIEHACLCPACLWLDASAAIPAKPFEDWPKTVAIPSSGISSSIFKFEWNESPAEPAPQESSMNVYVVSAFLAPLQNEAIAGAGPEILVQPTLVAAPNDAAARLVLASMLPATIGGKPALQAMHRVTSKVTQIAN